MASMYLKVFIEVATPISTTKKSTPDDSSLLSKATSLHSAIFSSKRSSSPRNNIASSYSPNSSPQLVTSQDTIPQSLGTPQLHTTHSTPSHSKRLSPNHLHSGASSDSLNLVNGSISTNQYTIVPITETTTALDVCRAVARRRNILLDGDIEYELAICDSDGMDTFEKSLGDESIPFQYQKDASKHGHLGAFRFVFRRIVDDDDDFDKSTPTDDAITDEFFSNNKLSLRVTTDDSNAVVYPAAWMEKRGRTNPSWKRRFFVLIDDQLHYYKNKQYYESGKSPEGIIELAAPPAVIRKSPLMDTPIHVRKRGRSAKKPDWFMFDIHTPRRIFYLRTENYDNMTYWVQLLQRRNEPTEILQDLDDLIGDSELMHAEEDELRLTQFGKFDNILSNKEASTAYLKYLEAQRISEFMYFWMDSTQFIRDYSNAKPAKRERFAKELYTKYIKSGSSQELSEVTYKQRQNIRKQIENGNFNRRMFDGIRTTVHNYLNRDAFTFLNSNDYFRFIVKYDENKADVTKYQWPNDWPTAVTIANRNRQSNISRNSSGNNSLNSSSVVGTNPMFIHTSIHSPVLHFETRAFSSVGSTGGGLSISGSVNTTNHSSPKSYSQSSQPHSNHPPNIEEDTPLPVSSFGGVSNSNKKSRNKNTGGHAMFVSPPSTPSK